MKNMKPVWRMNTGKDPKEDLISFLYSDKEISNAHSAHPSSWYRWEFMGGDDDIIAYETTRTREAKR
jgi:hypothetical protein